MKRTLALAGVLCAGIFCGGHAFARPQNSPGRVVIPARTSGGPRVIEISMTLGNIVVKTHPGGDVIAEVEGAATEYGRTVDGMHRIDIAPSDTVRVTEQDNVLRIQPPMRGLYKNMFLTVPVETSLSLKSTLGNITVEGVHGEIDATSTHGNITLTNVSGTVVASTTLGSQKISMDRVDQSKPLSFSSLNGSIDVTFPADLKASMSFRTGSSEVWSDFDVTMTGKSNPAGMHSLTTRNNRGSDERLYGTINGGGVEASFHAVNGRIMIHKKK